MPGLDTSNYKDWDENVYAQYKVARQNCNAFFDGYSKEFGILPNGFFYDLATRFATYANIPWDGGHPADIPGMMNLQKDIGALILLLDNDFDFSIFEGESTDLYETAKAFIAQKGTCDDIEGQFPGMTQDALKSIESDGAVPPADKMQTAQEYFSDRTHSVIT